MPVLAKLLGHDLDELGLSVCSVAGTHFLPYIKFFGPRGLNIPYAVVTDSDAGTPHNGIDRIRKVLDYLCPKLVAKVADDDALKALAGKHGLFLTDQTFEIALWQCGRKQSYRAAMRDLGSRPAQKRAQSWIDDSTSFNPTRMLSDIDAIGKGRFAQRWARYLAQQPKSLCPESIKDALKHVTDQIS